MLQRAMHVFSSFVLMFLFGVQSAGAVSFERIDVASHMGEPFYAEVPLRLDKSESLSKISIELGTASDYRILEVYRDQVIGKIRVDIVKDARGSRVKLSSESAIDTAFFNLVLKVRYGRSTHYKKMPIFLESAGASVLQSNEQPAVVAAPVNAATVKPETSDAFVTKVPVGAKTAFEEPVESTNIAPATPETQNNFKAFGDWARTSRYGPMVYGDTITTVAQRLRLDDRFTNQQVMVALFEKNKDKFGKGNINLIKAGSYLDVPQANEVKGISIAQAKAVISEQNKAWKHMVKQPKYAAVADAQRTRYTRRVRIGEQASGVASAPIAKPEPVRKHKRAEAVTKTKENTTGKNQAELLAAKSALAQKNDELSVLQGKMAGLERRLAKAEKTTVSVDAAALDAQNKRLEIVISRLKNQLEQAKKGAGEEQGAAGWMMYVLAGFGLLILGLIGAVVMLLRRSPNHPAEQDEVENNFDDVDDTHGQDEEVIAKDEPIAEEVSDVAGEPEAISVDDFEMPSEGLESETGSLDDMFEDGPLEEIPDFTDDETGEMEAFDADTSETPDPSVNYLEEADVYIRYGMEDEAEKQVKMALKLDDRDPAAYAKLIQIIRAKDDASAEEQVMSKAKGVLTGAALVTFEGLLSSDVKEGDISETSDVASLKEDDFTGDDTGIVDFGAINFDTNEPEPEQKQPEAKVEQDDVMEPDLLDTGKMDFGEVDDDAEDNDLTASGGIDFTGIDFGESNEIDASDSIDFGEINLGDDVATDDETEEVMDDSDLDTGELDFGELQDDEEALLESISDTELEGESLDDDSLEDVMDVESLNTGELDFGDLTLDSVLASDDVDVMEAEPLDTGKVDFGDMLSEAGTAPEKEKSMDDVMEAESLDTGEIDFGDLSADTNIADETKETDAVDFDFSDMGLTEEGQAEDNAEQNSTMDEMDQSIDLGEFGIDFNELDTLDARDVMPKESSSDENIDLESFELTGNDTLAEGLDEFDEDSTAAVAVTGDTQVVPSGEPAANLENAVNDRDVDRAIAEAEAEANAVSITLPDGEEDPFASANELLSEAEESSLSIDLGDDDLDSLLGEDEDLFALDDSKSSVNEKVDDVIPLTEIDDEPQSEKLDDIETPNKDIDIDASALDDLESISLDLSGLDEDLASTGLDEVKSIEDDLIPDIERDFEGLATIGDDLITADDVEDNQVVVDELALDDFDLGDLDVGSHDAPSTDTKPDNFDATVVLNKTPETIPESSVEVSTTEEDGHFSDLDAAVGDETLVMDGNTNPMDEEYSATGELKIIEESIESIQEDPMESFEATTELDGLMNDLKGLLDEDEPKK